MLHSHLKVTSQSELAPDITLSGVPFSRMGENGFFSRSGLPTARGKGGGGRYGSRGKGRLMEGGNHVTRVRPRSAST
ncbi:hypothetical protein CEXT_764631 [Caerostris extrusa]|uniref:Uncharacterized protein n=1 Tax=Caerostris extrusa TaxID=172846 RepID=A0AAV4N283_CAEEX|nr:hypothetical protein CEXT_764631 [Caerostris extrusa]